MSHFPEFAVEECPVGPLFTHLTVSPTEECRIVNLHRNLEEYLEV